VKHDVALSTYVPTGTGADQGRRIESRDSGLGKGLSSESTGVTSTTGTVRTVQTTESVELAI
jgi:hypothetical protein